MNKRIGELKDYVNKFGHPHQEVRLMFQDEAGFG
jgi:hypothetical protein